METKFKNGTFSTSNIDHQLLMTFSPFNAHSWIYELVCKSLPFKNGLKREKNRKIFAMKLVDEMAKSEQFYSKVFDGFDKVEIFIPK